MSSARFRSSLGQSVAIGVRRIHVLPTPLSSYTACADLMNGVENLAQHPFLVELAGRMKTRIAKRVEPALVECRTSARTQVSGVAVIARAAECGGADRLAAA